MLQAMFNGVSGVQAHKTMLDIIGNNVANVNTTAFKSSRTVFKDVISQTVRSATQPTESGLGGTNPFQVGLGVQVGAADLNLTQGSEQPTGKNTDVAIEGNGYLLTSDGIQKYYTRDGSFYLDSAGNLVSTGSGQHVLGWTADPQTGLIDTTQTITKNSAIRLLVGQTSIARATSTVDLGGNVDASVPVGTQVATTFSVYDSHGVPHQLTVHFQKTSTPGKCYWYADSPDSVTDTPATMIPDSTPATAASLSSSADVAGASASDGTLRFVLSDGSTTMDVPVSTGDTLADVVASINTASAALAAPNTNQLHASVSGNRLVIGNSTAGYTNTVQVATTGSSSDVLSWLQLNASQTGVGEALHGTGGFIPPTESSTLKIGDVSITVDPTETAQSLVDKINLSAAPAVASVNNGYVQLTAKSTSANGFSCVAGDGYSLQKVMGTNWTMDGGMGVQSISFDAGGKSNLSSVPLTLTMSAAEADGATNPIQIVADFSSITYLSGKGDSTVAAATQDGLQLGTLESFSIGSDGLITGRFDNGISQSLAQLAVADFRNSAGLAKAGSNLWQETSNSGLAQIGTAASGSRGEIAAGFLEGSNVDLPTEFTNMIVAQRGFSANARVITTSDEVLQELVQLKR